MIEIANYKRDKKLAESNISLLSENVENQRQMLEEKTDEIQKLEEERAIIKRKLTVAESDRKRLESEIRTLEGMLNLKNKDKKSSIVEKKDEANNAASEIPIIVFLRRTLRCLREGAAWPITS